MLLIERKVLGSKVHELRDRRGVTVRVTFQLECGHELAYDVKAPGTSRLYIRRSYRARKRANKVAKRTSCPCPACGPAPKEAAG